MYYSEGKQKRIDNEENKAWIDMLDSLVDFISASKTMIRIMNDKFVENGTMKPANSSPDLNKVLTLPDNAIKQIHINSAFSRTAPTTKPVNLAQEDMNKSSLQRFPRHRSASQFLDEQYNLTKQTIARRVRPQNRLATLPNSRNVPKQSLQSSDYVMNDTYTEGMYRISSPKGRPVYQERSAEMRHMDYSYLAKQRNMMYNSFRK